MRKVLIAILLFLTTLAFASDMVIIRGQYWGLIEGAVDDPVLCLSYGGTFFQSDLISDQTTLNGDMYVVTVPGVKYFDEKLNQFCYTGLKTQTLITNTNINNYVPTPTSKIYVGSAGNPYAQESGVKFLATSAATTNGNATFYLTDDGTANGNAMCTSIVYDNTADLEIDNSNAVYRYSWDVSGDRKTLTAAVTQSSSVMISGTQVLSALTPAPNGTLVRLNVWCK